MATNRMGPPCPECGSLVTDVIRTCRTEEGHFVRRRGCPCCGYRFNTAQPTEFVAPKGSVKWWADRTYRINWDLLPVRLLVG
jgi:hypothetical protein